MFSIFQRHRSLWATLLDQIAFDFLSFHLAPSESRQFAIVCFAYQAPWPFGSQLYGSATFHTLLTGSARFVLWIKKRVTCSEARFTGSVKHCFTPGVKLLQTSPPCAQAPRLGAPEISALGSGETCCPSAGFRVGGPLKSIRLTALVGSPIVALRLVVSVFVRVEEADVIGFSFIEVGRVDIAFDDLPADILLAVFEGSRSTEPMLNPTGFRRADCADLRESLAERGSAHGLEISQFTKALGNLLVRGAKPVAASI